MPPASGGADPTDTAGDSTVRAPLAGSDAMRTAGDLRDELERHLQHHLAVGSPRAILAVEAPTLGASFLVAAGEGTAGGPPRGDDGFAVADVTKGVTATAAVILASRGRWELDGPVTPWLPAGVVDDLTRIEGLTDVDELSLRRLLAHSTGLPDVGGGVGAPEDRVRRALSGARLSFAPGADFDFGDVGYWLVGLALEQLEGRPLAEVLRAWILEPLGMERTHLGGLDGSGEPADVAGDGADRWAAGGLVSTAEDLLRFLGGLTGPALLDDAWRAELTRWRESLCWRPRATFRYLRYGLGFGTARAYGKEIIGVAGSSGAFAFFWPATRTAMAGTLARPDADVAALLDAVVRAVDRSDG